MDRRVILSGVFGKDQEPVIDSILSEMGNKVDFVDKKPYSDDKVQYRIGFNNAFHCYEFGHAQGSRSAEEILKALR